MREEHEINRVIEQYADMVQRICFLHLNNRSDTEDMFQTIFLKYALSSVTFKDSDHEKAWLIRVSINACKDRMRSLLRHPTVPLDLLAEQAAIPVESRELLSLVLALPKKYKDVIYLFYYEGYTAVEIAKILNKNENTIYSLLSRARKQLKEQLGGEAFE
ncbi:MAG: sigma-70 family RNA polymerase sigma factor [Hungatella sp.]